MVEIKRTSSVVNDGIKISLSGLSGAGKTYSIRTVKNPLIISSESGLLSIRDCDFPYIPVGNLEEFKEALNAISVPEVWNSFDTLVIDSVTDIAERCLSYYKKHNKDGRAAYGQMIDSITDVVNQICDSKGKDIVCIFKLGRIEDKDTGKVSYGADTPSDKLAVKLPYPFDEVFVLKSEVNEEGQIVRYIQTFNDGHYTAKDRSGCLDPYEPCDIGAIIEKIKGGSLGR